MARMAKGENVSDEYANTNRMIETLNNILLIKLPPTWGAHSKKERDELQFDFLNKCRADAMLEQMYDNQTVDILKED